MDADLILRVIVLFVFVLVAAISNYYCSRARQEGRTIKYSKLLESPLMPVSYLVAFKP